MKKYWFFPQLVLTFLLLIISTVSLFAHYTQVILPNTNNGNWKPPVGCDSFFIEILGAGAGGNTSVVELESTTTSGGGNGANYVKTKMIPVTATSFTNGFTYSVGSRGTFYKNGKDS